MKLLEKGNEMRTVLWLLSVSVSLFVAGVAMAQQPPGTAAVAKQPGTAAVAKQPTVKPVASVKELMEAMVIPSSDALFNVARQAPKDEKEWAAVRNSAVILTESGNLLMIGGRARDKQAWMKMSHALVDAGAVALKAAQAKNVDALTDAGNQIADVCETCHERYLDKGRQK